MDWATELAQELKNRENESKIGNQIGVVASTDPLKVSILEGAVILDDELYCLNHLLAHSVNCKINGIDSTIDFESQLNIGDSVLVSPSENQQSWFIVGKI